MIYYIDQEHITYFLEKCLYGKENIKNTELDRLYYHNLLCKRKFKKLTKKLIEFLNLPKDSKITAVEIDKETKNKSFIIKTSEELIEVKIDKNNNIQVLRKNEKDTIREYSLIQFSYNPGLPPYETKKVDFGIIPKKVIKNVNIRLFGDVILPKTTIIEEFKENTKNYITDSVTISAICGNYELRIKLKNHDAWCAALSNIYTTYEYNKEMKCMPKLSKEEEEELFKYLKKLSFIGLQKNIDASLKEHYDALTKLELIRKYQIEVSIIKRNNEHDEEEYTTNGKTKTITFRTDGIVTKKCKIKNDEVISFTKDGKDNYMKYETTDEGYSFKFTGRNGSLSPVDRTVEDVKNGFMRLLK